MSWFLAGALLVAAAVAARSTAGLDDRTGPPEVRWFSSVAEAVDAALRAQPVVVAAFGELHQTQATAGIPSALRRFTDEIWPAFADRFSHLVVETWVTTGRCGPAERAATADVERTTERPSGTGGEIETLIRAAAARGATPRILSVSCADYRSMIATAPGTGSVDYDRVLRITERALVKATLGALRERWRTGPREPRRPAALRPALAIYGGALHNDLHPLPGLAPYSFASELTAATLGRYVEIDLVVPEYAREVESVRVQPWWRLYLRSRASPGSGRQARQDGARRDGPMSDATALIRRSARSFVIVLPANSSRTSSP